MSLDVYLKSNTKIESGSGSKIYVREDGQTKEISREEWEERFPGIEAITIEADDPHEVYSANITHNLGRMAREAGIYKELWRPDEIEITKAKQLIKPLSRSLSLLMSAPQRFKKLNPENGWGNYEGLLGFVKGYLKACEKYPDAEVSVWR